MFNIYQTISKATLMCSNMNKMECLPHQDHLITQMSIVDDFILFALTVYRSEDIVHLISIK